MLDAEDTGMLQHSLKANWIRGAIAIYLTSLTLACQRAESAPSGRLDIVLGFAGSGERAAVPTTGRLELHGLSSSAKASVSGAELETHGAAGRELPAGLYALHWSPGLPTRAATDALSLEPALVRVVPGERTTLTLRMSTPIASCSLTSLPL
jgi:hypothetical protein